LLGLQHVRQHIDLSASLSDMTVGIEYYTLYSLYKPWWRYRPFLTDHAQPQRSHIL